MTIGYYIYIVSVSGYYCRADWQSWADRQILNNDEVEEWIYKVSLAKDIEELCIAISEKNLEESYYEEHKSPLSDAIVGYYYMLYIENKISLSDLINKLSDEDDISNTSTIHEYENFYDIWNQINLNKELIIEKSFIEKIKKLLEPYKMISANQLDHINNY